MLALLAGGSSALVGPALAPAQQLRSSRPRLQAPVAADAPEVQPPAGFVWSYDEPLPPKGDAPRLEGLSITGPKALAKSRKRVDNYPEVPSLRECLRFAVPALGIYCAGPLMSLIDAAFVGRASSLQLASLGPASSISDSAPLPLLFLSIGATNLVAQAHGRGDLRAQALTTRVGLALGIAGASVLGALVLGFSTPLSSLYCGGSLLLTPPCVAYVRIRALALPAVVVASIAQAVCVGSKDTRTPMLAVLLAAGLNLAGDFLLVSKMGLGIAGAAWATTFSQLCAAGLLLLVLTRRGLLSAPVPSPPPPPPLRTKALAVAVAGAAAAAAKEAKAAAAAEVRTVRASLLGFAPFLFVMAVKMGMHNGAAATAASLGGAAAAAHTALFATGMLCFTIGDVGSSLAQAYLPAFYSPAAAEDPGRRRARLSAALMRARARLPLVPLTSRWKTWPLSGPQAAPPPHAEAPSVPLPPLPPRTEGGFNVAASRPTLTQLLRYAALSSVVVVACTMAFLVGGSSGMSRDPAVIAQMRAVAPLMAATLCLHGTAVTLEGVLVAQKAFLSLGITYATFAATAAASFTAIRSGLWAPGGSGLLGIWLVYVWFQVYRVALFVVLGGLLPRWARPRRTDAADATGAVDALVAADAVGA